MRQPKTPPRASSLELDRSSAEPARSPSQRGGEGTGARGGDGIRRWGRRHFAIASAVLLAPSWATPTRAAAESVEIVGREIKVGDLVPSAPATAARVVVGAAPPPGSSLLVARRRLRHALSEAGVDPGQLELPEATRVFSAFVRLSAGQWARVAKQHLAQALPDALQLVATSSQLPLTLPKTYRLGRVKWPPRPRNPGAWRTTVRIEILHDDAPIRSVPVGVVARVGEGGQRAGIRRGQALSLVVARGVAEVSMQGVALGDAELGRVTAFRVVKTQRVVRARVESVHRALVVEERR